MPDIKPADITPGTVFPSPRVEEGRVRAVCPFGACTHGEDRSGSVHVYSMQHGTHFFIALIDYEPLHVCDGTCDVFDPDHATANRSQQ